MECLEGWSKVTNPPMQLFLAFLLLSGRKYYYINFRDEVMEARHVKDLLKVRRKLLQTPAFWFLKHSLNWNVALFAFI
jgi:hypothetical protein